jgi:hypothetical protein
LIDLGAALGDLVGEPNLGGLHIGVAKIGIVGDQAQLAVLATVAVEVIAIAEHPPTAAHRNLADLESWSSCRGRLHNAHFWTNLWTLPCKRLIK